LKKFLKISLLIVVTLAFAAGCTSFQHLTRLHSHEDAGPKASDCGSCHVLQFQEWSGSPHAQAFISPPFQKEFVDSGEEEECLGCHAPLEIRQGNTEARNFNRDEGVTCISCHLSQGKMHGPHKSSALLHPHPVHEEDAFYLSVEICAVCHGETFTEYRQVAEREEVQSCLECHAPRRQRTASQGTNFISKALVSFEDEVDTRSHLISIASMQPMSKVVGLTVLEVSRSPGHGSVDVEITNNLPHNLPTGTFAEKSIRLVLRFVVNRQVVAENMVVVSDEQVALIAGEIKRLTISAVGQIDNADTLELLLERHSSPFSSRPAIVLDSKTISLITENMS
jgi:Zn-finger protein